MPDGQYPPTVKLGKIGVDSNKSNTLGEKLGGGLNNLEDLLEYDRLMGKSILLNEKDLTQKVGIFRGEHVSVGAWNTFAAMYTVGSNDGSCGITFETQEKGTSEGVACAVERMRIDAAGNVGIGTATPVPNAKLDIQGGGLNVGGLGNLDASIHIKSSYGGFNRLLQMSPAGVSKPGLNLLASTNPNSQHQWWAWGVDTDNKWKIQPGASFSGSTGFFVDSAGNAGIGTSAPNVKLEVQGDVRIDDHNIYLRGGNDPFHGLGWFGASKLFASNNVNGPVIFGGDGGALGTTSGGQKIALSWDKNGDVKVSGDVFLVGADCAEDFDIVGAECVQSGTVMIIDNDGALRPSEQAYDKRVAGVISGAGDYRPGITLDKQSNKSNRLPLALTGKVYCKVDAEYDPVEVGDLLTTSSTIGHAMKAEDRDKAFGSVIGKALRKLEDGRGLIPILVALQ